MWYFAVSYIIFRFQDVLFSDDSSYYSYNPCGGFNEGSDCSNAAVNTRFIMFCTCDIPISIFTWFYDTSSFFKRGIGCRPTCSFEVNKVHSVIGLKSHIDCHPEKRLLLKFALYASRLLFFL